VLRKRFFITGRVQGVGFRPAVYRLAGMLGLTGTVFNDTRGVTLELQGADEKISEFVTRLRTTDRPPLATIESCAAESIGVVADEQGFSILHSQDAGTALSQVTPDMATCAECLQEMADQADFRFAYPFINCTNCGPRYSLVRAIPYDRPNTTMSVFPMCRACAGQYADIADRRFHAQPVACAQCGPHVWLSDNRGKVLEETSDASIQQAADWLKAGKIVAIKGVGGFHLAVDALNDEAVLRLRERKRREHKPFALMADSVETIQHYAIVSEQAAALLTSPASPIVLLPRIEGTGLAPVVAEGVNTLGFMLCYAPLHSLLFAQGIHLLVMTSANLSDEPLICENALALERLGPVADAFLLHNRDIYRQVDDSIVHFIAEQPVLLRRSRGYVPSPLFLTEASRMQILATGADLKNTVCFVKQDQLLCSEHIGDLADALVYRHYRRSIDHLQGLFEVEPDAIACDLHPGYFSTQVARSLSGKRKLIQIQHHWAHVASCLAEHGEKGPVIGLVADGTGYGTDGAIWGCECLLAGLKRFERFGHQDYFLLAGADLASKQAVRPAMGLLLKAHEGPFDIKDHAWLLQRIEGDAQIREVVHAQLSKNLNCVRTSSLGRVFDAVAALLGLGKCNHFDAQLPIALEAIAADNVKDTYDFALCEPAQGPLVLDWSPMIRQICDDMQRNREVSVIAALFHNTIAAGLFEMARRAREATRINTVALSGGVFCNRYLIERLIKLLNHAGFSVLFNQRIPSNDGGIAVGQAAIAAELANHH
jgi:hydrogenase maturation protein HypF